MNNEMVDYDTLIEYYKKKTEEVVDEQYKTNDMFYAFMETIYHTISILQENNGSKKYIDDYFNSSIEFVKKIMRKNL